MGALISKRDLALFPLVSLHCARYIHRLDSEHDVAATPISLGVAQPVTEEPDPPKHRGPVCLIIGCVTATSYERF